MQVLAALLLAALAACQTNAQPATIEYDIINCTAYNLPQGIHHAYHQDCRRFYNCDNNNGGKTTNCPAGLIFNRDTYICDFNAKCEDWDRQACFPNQFGQRDPTRSMMFPALCCREYFEYSCQDGGTWTHNYCPDNQQFDPNTRQCSPGFTGDCTECGTPPTNDNACNYTHMQYVDECHYRSTAVGIDTLRWCPQGTVMSREACTCVGSNDLNSCKQASQQCIEGDKSELRFDSGRFYVPFAMEPKLRWVQYTSGAAYTGNEAQFTPASYANIFHFMGNSLGPEGAYRITFNPDVNSISGETSIISTGDPNDPQCNNGVRVALIASRSGGGLNIRFRVIGYDPNTQQQSQPAEISANVNAGNIRVAAIVQRNADGNLVLSGRVKVNNGAAQDMNGNGAVTNYDSITNPSCGLQIGRFQGAVSEFAFWRCTGPSLLLNI